jgi:type VI secretion system protein ImpL
LRSRLNEEFDVERRKRLFALPQELAGLSAPLIPMLDEIFLASRFDRTQLHDTLRGVYFTSGAQAESTCQPIRAPVFQRLQASLGVLPHKAAGSTRAQGQQGFFLQNVLTKVIIPEAHLVRPNLRWEFRFRLLRLTGHALSGVIFLWLAGALALSFGNNRQYLSTVGQRVDLLSRARSARCSPASSLRAYPTCSTPLANCRDTLPGSISIIRPAPSCMACTRRADARRDATKPMPNCRTTC